MEIHEPSDAELIASYLEGDAQAFRALEARYRKQIFTWLVSSLGNRSDAEDLYQEIWFRVIKNAESFRDVSFKAWLWKIARNRVIDFRRKKRPDLTLDQTFGDDDQPMVEKLCHPGAGPAQKLENEDLTQKIMSAVDELPESQREVFLMRVEAHMSFKEIAEAMDVSINTVLGRMHDAMKKIKRQMAEVI